MSTQFKISDTDSERTESLISSQQSLNLKPEPPPVSLRSFLVNLASITTAEGDKYVSNRVKTCKYSILTFIPLNLMVQFSKMANCYFLLLVLMEYIPAVYTPGGPASMITPLAFVILVSMIKDIIEDRARYLSDEEENKRVSHASKRGQELFRDCEAQSIQIGSFVKVKDDENFPCDMILINSSLPKGICYVETKGLDGETNLKQKQAKSETLQWSQNEQMLFKSFTGAQITCDLPNAQLYKFEGQIKMIGGETIGLTNDQLLLKGCQLRNTGYVYGISVYTGHQTKIMENSLKGRAKKSKMELATNKYILLVVLIQTILCLLAALYSCVWVYIFGESIGYLGFNYTTSSDTDFQLYIISFMQWFLALMNFVNIALYVTLEISKFFQGYFIEQDWMMYDIMKDMCAKCQSSNLNEELGTVSYVFSDKTGTLTQNVMEFKKFTAGSFAYGVDNPTEQEYQPGVTNVNFEDETFWQHWNDTQSDQFQHIFKFVECLGICHTIISEQKEIKGQKAIVYNASSPDELALVNGMRHFGFSFIDRDEEDNIVIEFRGERLLYRLLHILEFTSDRKRMSVIVRNPQNEIMVVCKGADSVINARLLPDQPFTQSTNMDLDSYAEVGLRTLLVAYRYLDEETYQEWLTQYKIASAATQNRDQQIAALAEKVEVDFLLAGCSAIEDKLQDDVGQTISDIRKADIKVWVLTGDKVETAINIGQSCQLLTKEQNWMALQGNSQLSLKRELNDLISKQKSAARKSAIILDGTQLSIIQSEHGLIADFVDLCTSEQTDVVLVCRVSPQQKADVVIMVKTKMPNKSTLAIGDGANDVSMITAAHIGIGISGLEGQQAARSSDYSITQFKHLKNLLFVHGREAYRRNSYLIVYMFYKNVIYVIPILVFGLWSAFSATIIFNMFLYNLYSVVFTALPVIWYSVFDWEFDKQTLLSKGYRHYRIGLDDVYFSPSEFWRWFLDGVWQGIIICYLCFYTLDSAQEQFGQIGGLIVDGNFIFAALVVIVNVKILINSYEHTFWSWFFIFGSILSYFLTFDIMSHVEVLDTYGAQGHMFNQLQDWNMMILLSFCFVLIESGVQMVKAEIREYVRVKRAQLEKSKKKKIKTDITLDQERFQNFVHKGYAFSGAEGNSALVTDNLTNRLKSAMHQKLFGGVFQDVSIQ